MENYLYFRTYKNYYSPTHALNSISTRVFFELEIWQRVKYFFVDLLDGKLALFENLKN